MKFENYGELIPNALDVIENEIESIETFLKSLIKRLNSLLSFLYEKNSNFFNEYVLNLQKKYNSFVEENPSENEFYTSELLNEFEKLKEYPKLVENYISFILQTLMLTKNDKKKKVKIKHKNYLRAFLLPRYYNLSVLVDIYGREEAIKLYKYFVSQNIKENSSPTRKIFDTVDEFRDYFIKDKEETTVGWIGVLSEIKNGKFFFRKDNCLWAEILQDIPDKELKYLVCCYGDFQAANSRSSGNFVLTMKHTIVEGDPYCDCIYHDTNIDWNLSHPGKEFWDNITPSQK